MDLKVHAKVIANRLRSSIPFLIHLDEVGFVPHREARDNTITGKSLNIINYAKKQKTPLCILSIDAENVFDRLNYKFLFKVLEGTGVPWELITKIMALYSFSSGCVKIMVSYLSLYL